MFLKRQTVQRSIEESGTDLFIGHCRWATHGDASDNKNNHPHFSRDGRFAIVHNGVIHCYDWLTRDEKLDASKGDCDSEVIAHLIMSRLEDAPARKAGRKRGILDCIETLDDYRGDFAVAALDRDSRCIWLFRNEANPLWYVRIPALGITFFASEPNHIHKAICTVLNKRARKHWGYKRGNIMSLNPGQAAILMQNGAMMFSKNTAPLNDRTNKWVGYRRYRGYVETTYGVQCATSGDVDKTWRDEEPIIPKILSLPHGATSRYNPSVEMTPEAKAEEDALWKKMAEDGFIC